MKTKNIFKALAMAMMMPAMLLTTACSNEDDAINNGDNKKGYPLQVTVNVTRQSDATTRATYTDNGNGTGSLGFSAGDKLFVSGSHTSAGQFAGALTWQSGGTFSGTIYTQNPYTGTADALFSDATSILATLLPNGYDSYNFLSIYNNSSDDLYDDVVAYSMPKAFVASETAKKTGVEQLSWEKASTYSSGFALAPANAVLNFTISGLQAGEKAVTLITNYTGASYGVTISGSVTPNASGVATFAIGVTNDRVIKNVDNNLTVGSSNFTLPGGTALTAGKIYNITRGTGGTVDLSTKNTAYTAQNGETLTGTLANNVKISIADGATVILHNVNINGSGTWTSGNYAGITCNGDATIILSGTNTVKGFYEDYPGIYVPENKTVTIQGTGSLTASSNGWAAGIGGGNTVNCGNITITGGNITATGGSGRAGIGGGSGACGNITITGGTITATGGNNAAGIGGGTDGTCGNITITSGVTRVTATKGNIAPNSIGAGGDGTCGTVTIGGVITGNITDSPYTYPAPAPSYTMAANATAGDVGKLICTDGHIHVYGEDAACTAGRVAVIAYVGSAGSVDASSASYKGLAIALSDANSGNDCQWAGSNVYCLNGIGGQTDAIATALGFMNGITCTSTLTAAGHSSHGHAAATAAASNNGTAAPTGASGWFMPSMGQWNLIVQGLATKKAGSAITTDLAEDVENNTYKANNLNSVITDAGGTGLKADSYWTSTEETHVRVWAMDFWNGNATGYAKSVNNYVRSIIAF
jgi:hypothetical protein